MYNPTTPSNFEVFMGRKIRLIIKDQVEGNLFTLLTQLFPISVDGSYPTVPFFYFSHLEKETIDASGFKWLTPFYFHNFRFVSLQGSDGPEYIYAKIEIVPIDQNLFVTFTMQHEVDEDWEIVKNMVTQLIKKMELLEFKLKEVEPPELLPKSMLKLWEQIKDHGNNRGILELWHDEHTYKEIADKLGLEAGSVANTLSALRKEYGEEIVPKKEQIRRANRLKN